MSHVHWLKKDFKNSSTIPVIEPWLHFCSSQSNIENTAILCYCYGAAKAPLFARMWWKRRPMSFSKRILASIPWTSTIRCISVRQRSPGNKWVAWSEWPIGDWLNQMGKNGNTYTLTYLSINKTDSIIHKAYILKELSYLKKMLHFLFIWRVILAGSPTTQTRKLKTDQRINRGHTNVLLRLSLSSPKALPCFFPLLCKRASKLFLYSFFFLFRSTVQQSRKGDSGNSHNRQWFSLHFLISPL